ncbi:hypothetical protein HT105_23205, partial [Bacteroides fragilis]|nr:hypothetical protein [Bacteroides fragilis]
LEVNDLPDGNVEIKFPDGANITQILTDIGAKIKTLPDGTISLKDNSPEVQQRLQDLGLAVKDEQTGEVKIKDNIAEVIQLEVNDLPDGNVEIKFPDGANITQILTDIGAKI